MIDNNVKRARWRAIVVGALATLTLIAFVFAFIQHAEAQRQATLLLECEKKSVELANELEVKNQEAKRQLEMAQDAYRQAVEMRLRAESESKKK